MRPLLLAATFFSLTTTALFAARNNADTALGAIKALPKGEWKRIARIEARDGTPVPERWHIITHDPKDENGLHEYVIAGGELVASRAISQFAENVKAEDVVSSSLIKVDSDKLADLAQAYAQANNVTIVTLNYALKKEGAEAVALWHVTCLDEAGKEVGRLAISAGKGTVVSREGFTAEPGAAALLDTQVTDEMERESRRQKQKATQVRVMPRQTPPPTPPQRKGFMGKFGEFFTGRPPEPQQPPRR